MLHFRKSDGNKNENDSLINYKSEMLEIENREKTENNLKGQNDKIRAPTYLTKKQKNIFKYKINKTVYKGCFILLKY